MNLKDLKYLVALADTGHFGRAAQRTFVSQPTLSAQLKKLEEYLGVKLVERHPKNVQLTEVGRQIGLRHTPSLEFVADVLPDSAKRIEDLVTKARHADAELARSREGAVPAGDPDPYRKPAADSDEDDYDS